MTGRLNDVLAELSVLGAVRMEQLPPRRPAPPPEPAAEPALAPAPEPPQADEDVPPVDDDVEAKIRALSSGYAAEPDLPEEDSEVPDRAFPDRTFPEPPVEEAIEDEASEVEDEEPLPRHRDSPKTARRLREAFARLELLEACAADLREALEAVAKTMEER